jgi:hypothetical protein
MHIVQVDEGFGTTEAFGSTEKRWRVVDDTETVVPFIPGTEDMRDYVAIYSFATEAQARSFLYEWQNLTKDQILQWMDRSEIRVEETLFGPPEGVDADWVMRYRQTSDAHVKLHDAVIILCWLPGIWIWMCWLMMVCGFRKLHITLCYMSMLLLILSLMMQWR